MLRKNCYYCYEKTVIIVVELVFYYCCGISILLVLQFCYRLPISRRMNFKLLFLLITGILKDLILFILIYIVYIICIIYHLFWIRETKAVTACGFATQGKRLFFLYLLFNMKQRYIYTYIHIYYNLYTMTYL